MVIKVVIRRRMELPAGCSAQVDWVENVPIVIKLR